MEKKFAILRLTADGEDRLIIQPVLIENRTLAAARRSVLKEFHTGTVAWIGWMDKYTIYDPIKVN